jgi:hypothetical protein
MPPPRAGLPNDTYPAKNPNPAVVHDHKQSRRADTNHEDLQKLHEVLQ